MRRETFRVDTLLTHVIIHISMCTIVEYASVFCLFLLQYRYTILNLTGAFISLSVILQDERIYFVFVFIFLSGLCSSFGDAMPSGMRRSSSITTYSTGVISLVIVQAALLLKLIKIQDRSLQLGSITFTCSSFAVNFMTNMTIFWIRHIITAIRYPTSLTVLKSQVKSEKIPVAEAKLLIAAFHLINNTNKK